MCTSVTKLRDILNLCIKFRANDDNILSGPIAARLWNISDTANHSKGQQGICPSRHQRWTLHRTDRVQTLYFHFQHPYVPLCSLSVLLWDKTQYPPGIPFQDFCLLLLGTNTRSHPQATHTVRQKNAMGLPKEVCELCLDEKSKVFIRILNEKHSGIK